MELSQGRTRWVFLANVLVANTTSTQFQTFHHPKETPSIFTRRSVPFQPPRTTTWCLSGWTRLV